MGVVVVSGFTIALVKCQVRSAEKLRMIAGRGGRDLLPVARLIAALWQDFSSTFYLLGIESKPDVEIGFNFNIPI